MRKQGAIASSIDALDAQNLAPQLVTLQPLLDRVLRALRN
jgi:hypothetical protein